MRRLIITAAAVAVVALTGCDAIADRTTPVTVATTGTVKPGEVKPGLWTTIPPQTQAGCRYALLRNGVPVAWTEVHDSVKQYVYLPPSKPGNVYSFTTQGCGVWGLA